MWYTRRTRSGGIQAFGCAPGCLVVSILLSIGLTILLNVLVRAF